MQRLTILREKVRAVLCNKLTYPKTIISLFRDRQLSEDKLEKMLIYIDEAIAMVDAKFLELLIEFDNRK